MTDTEQVDKEKEVKAVAKKSVKKAAPKKKATAKAAVSKKAAPKKTAVKKAAAKPVAKPAGKALRLTLTRSKNGRLASHKACVAGLGLRKMHQTVEVIDTPENRGMINKIQYMLNVEEV